jgi:sialidase-1
MKKILFLFLVICFWTILVHAMESGEPFLEKTRMFYRNLDPPNVDYRYNYRIPSLVVTKDGTILAFASKRKAPKDYDRLNIRDWGHDSDVALLRSTDKGKTWEDERIVASKDSVDIHCGPALVDYQTGRIFKFMRFHPAWDYDSSKEYAFTVPLQQMRNEGYGDYYVISDDDGQTWADPQPIYLPYPENAFGCVVGNGIHGIQLTSGRLIIQARYYFLDDYNNEVTHRTLFYSDDHGQTWNHGAAIKSSGVAMSTMEFPIVEYKPNEIYLNFRSGDGYRLILYSLDGGLTVTNPVQDKNLPGPKCHAGLIRYPSETEATILFCCPGIQYGGDVSSGDARHRLTIYYSRDGGRNWQNRRAVNVGKAAYSDIAVLPDSSIICFYESGRNDHYDFLEFARFNLAWVKEYIETESLYQESTIFQAGTGGYYTYRKPTIIQTPNRDLLAFCEGRKNSFSETGNIDVVMKRSVDNGETWSDVTVVWDDSVNTCSNPSPVVDWESGEIFLLMTWNNGADNEKAIIDQTSIDTRKVFVISSQDNGLSWGNAREITEYVKSPDWTWYVTGPVHGIQLKGDTKKGRLVIPFNYIEATTKNRSCGIIYSDDHGLTWQAGGTVSDHQAGESTVAELSNGGLVINMMDFGRRHKSRKHAFSEDGGDTWSDIYYDPDLIEPLCQASLLRYSFADEGESRLLFSNPAVTYSKANLTLRISYDEGSTWSSGKTIYRGHSANSDLVALVDNTIGLVYERDAYLKINYARFNLFWLTNGQDSHVVTSVPEIPISSLPFKYKLMNYPNPFNPTASIRFELPNETKVKLTVYNIRGQMVATLVNGHRTAGIHNVQWNANDLPSGIYLYKLDVGKTTLIRKLTLLK